MTSTQQKSSDYKNNQDLINNSSPVLRVINSEDYNTWKQSANKILIAPIVFFSATTLLILVAKKLQIRKLLANPLLKQQVLTRSKDRWNFLIKHSVIFGTLAVAAGAYFKKQFNKYLIFKQYEKEVNFYMRWKIENQIVDFINEQKIEDNSQKIKNAGKIF